METISSIFKALMGRNKVTPQEVINATNIPKSTVYSLMSRDSTRVDINILKKLADYFDEDLDVFCGLECYVRPIRLTKEEQQVVKALRGHPKEIRLQLEAMVKSPPKEQEKQERRLLESYRSMSQDGKEKINEYVADLVAVGRYAAD